MKNLITAHIRQTTYECSAEREIRQFKNADRLANATIIASALAIVALLIAGAAYAVSGPKVFVAVGTFANEKVALTLETGSGCAPGEYVAAKIVRDKPIVTGCWMQPTPDDVSVRWVTTKDSGPGSSDNGHYWMSKFKTQHIEIH